MGFFGPAPWLLILVGLVALSFGLPLLLWLLKRMLHLGSAPPLSGWAYLFLLPLCLALLASAAGSAGLILALRDHVKADGKTRIGQVMCVQSTKTELRVEYIAIDEEGLRDVAESYPVTGTECAVVGEILKFRPFLHKIGLGTFARVTGVAGAGTGGQGTVPELKPIKRDGGHGLPPWLALYSDGRRGPLGVLLADARNQALVQKPTGRTPLDLYVTPDGYLLESATASARR